MENEECRKFGVQKILSVEMRSVENVDFRKFGVFYDIVTHAFKSVKEINALSIIVNEQF